MPGVPLPEYLEPCSHLIVDLVVHAPTAAGSGSSGGGGGGSHSEHRRTKGRRRIQYRYTAQLTGGNLADAAQGNSYVAAVLRYMRPSNAALQPYGTADSEWSVHVQSPLSQPSVQSEDGVMLR